MSGGVDDIVVAGDTTLESLVGEYLIVRVDWESQSCNSVYSYV